MFVITADQRESRTNVDLVPDGVLLAERAGADRLALPVERNAGDELQAMTESAAAALEIGLELLRDGRWSVGLGAGASETPLPGDIRAARGPVFVLARDAVDRAKHAAGRIAVSAPDAVAAADAEAFLRLLVDLRDRRSDQGWEVADLLARGMTQKSIAAELGITPTAVSLRAKAAGLRLEEAATPALVRTLERLDA
jgi:hypothetical protein